jgi:DNA polymerase-1
MEIASQVPLPTTIFPGNTVLGDGPMPCDWMFIGEAPGAVEDQAGRPFSGPSGKLFNTLLERFTELRRPFVYVTNVCKHRPPDNRTPKVSEVKPYLPYLYEEIREVNPKVIVTLGGTAAKVFDGKFKITAEHGIARQVELPNIWSGVLVPWFHPAFAIRNADARVALAADAERLHAQVAQLGLDEPALDYGLGEENSITDYLLAHWGAFGLDTETTSPTRANSFMTDEADMIGYSVSMAPRMGRYVPAAKVGQGMAAVISSPLWTKVCHNAKFEYKIFKKQGVELIGYEDTKLAAYLLGESHTGLKLLARQHLNTVPILYREVTQGRDMSDLSPSEISSYASSDADHTLRLWSLFRPALLEQGLWSVYTDIEKPLIPVLAGMEARGIALDSKQCFKVLRALRAASAQALEEVANALRTIDIDPSNLNINSGDQVGALLEELKAPITKRTAGKGRLVVDSTTLADCREWWPELIVPLLAYRKYEKLVVYVMNFLKLKGPDGRLHTSFNQSGHWEEGGNSPLSAPSTGRISSSGPNLQNIPHHRAVVDGTDWGVEIRGCLAPKDGHWLMSCDIAQEEPRIVAVLAQDHTLLDAFAQGKDIYRPATEALYPYTEEPLSDGMFKQIYEHERFIGKTFFLAWYYGAGAGRLKTLDPALQAFDVKRGLALMTDAHPARDEYLKKTKQQLRETGVVESHYGRKRWIYKAWSHDPREFQEALREGANMRVQATAADILKIALVKIDNLLQEHYLTSRLVSTVHDEVVLEVADDELPRVAYLVTRAFDGLLPNMVLPVEASIGKDWGHMELYEWEKQWI